MESKNVYSIIVDLVKVYFTGEILSDAQMVNIRELLTDNTLYKAAELHDLTHLVGASLYKNGFLADGGEIADKFNNAQAMAMYRYQMITYEQSRLCDCLEKNGINFMPLKGAVLREFYPEPWLRTSCDIDVLIHEDDLSTAISVMKQQLGYTSDEKKGSHDVSLFSKSGVHIELHYSLYESMNLDEIWKLSSLKEGTVYHHLMSDEIFYCHQIAHIAKHFSYSGCGIRLFLDVWLLNKAVKYDKEELLRVLTNSGLVAFAEATDKLIDVWFNGAKPDELITDMENYIFGSGIYGTLTNNVIINQKRSGGKFKYAINRIFPPITRMAYYYPSLHKYKFLLPVFYVSRLFRLAFGKRSKAAFSELKLNNSAPTDKQVAVLSLMNRLDLM